MNNPTPNSRITVYNTLSGKEEQIKPITPGVISMYHCGPTVYDFAHIGNLRAYIFADTLRRTIESAGYDVKQVINITDVGHLTSDADQGEDKMEESARKKHKTAKEITEEYTAAFLNDLTQLNIRTAGTIFPKATDHIPEQIALIKKLEENGYTYTTSDGVYFDTSKFSDYGTLGGIDLEGLKSGARVEENPEKKNHTDFAVWKFSKEAGTRQQEWDSPWGVGFPGWHIECSAMSMKYLGETFDIHTGGIDHIPVHHNNEIAQSQCATGKTYVHTWMHSAFMTVDGHKMSKSLGNTYTLSDLQKKNIDPLALRYFFLNASYRLQVNFTLEAVESAGQALHNLYALVETQPQLLRHFGKAPTSETSSDIPALIEAMNSDLNTSKALSILWQGLKNSTGSPQSKIELITIADKYLGLGLTDALTLPPLEVLNLATERESLRAAKDFTASDTLKVDIRNAGYAIQDSPSGPILLRIR
ncbi:MAG TPA: cysteine--tRNA ligase [Candidatus Paceibacterota bacterium]|nr:cysteine--tRNA ligase [Candidatus Paceibacterota bacterium]